MQLLKRFDDALLLAETAKASGGLLKTIGGRRRLFGLFLHSTVESRFSKVNFLSAVCLHFLASFQLFIYILATFSLLLTALYLHLKY